MRALRKSTVVIVAAFVGVLWFVFSGLVAHAATLRLTPATGVYTTGAQFTVTVAVNTAGQSINAAEGTLTFDPKQVSVVSVSRSTSIFSLWVTEPAFSNSAGTVSFSGGSPAGYNGTAGTVMTVTLRANSAGSPRLNFASGAVLANDGKGTNVLTNMTGGSFTIGAATSNPEAEVITYVAPANTPAAPRVNSTTHPDERAWYSSNKAVLSWEVPSQVTEVRTLLDDRPTSVPTKVYSDPIRTITLDALPQGVSYFHIQFRNNDGWGAVTHYRLAVDSERPSSFAVALPEDADVGNPEQTLVVSVVDATSRVLRYKVKIDDGDYIELADPLETGRIVLPAVSPGYHTVLLEALDEAGNGAVTTFSFTVESFAAPVFIEYPTELGEGIIPVLRGTTRPSSTVTVTVNHIGADSTQYTTISDATGAFTFIPRGSFTTGVYEITAEATDVRGAKSSVSEPLRIAVQQPGFLRVGTLLISVVSVILSLVALIVLSVLGGGYMLRSLKVLRRRVTIETREATTILRREFATLNNTLLEHEAALTESRKGARLTRAETEMIATFKAALRDAERRVLKEVVDVEQVVNGKD